MKHLIWIVFGVLVITQKAFAQYSPDYTGGLKVNLNEKGTKYFRLISWAQVHANYNSAATGNTAPVNMNLRRARVLMFSQINKNFLILTHFGLNSLNHSTLSPTGKGDGSQLFFHDVWLQYNIAKNHSIGGGLHYFNGISRLNNQSTLNMMTLDNNRQSWSTIGLTDQFARHLGVFGKGSFGKLQYRVAINDAMTNGLDDRTPILGEGAVYGGKRLLGSLKAGLVYAGYFEYQFLESESNFLPFKTGTYLGTKKIFNIGAGFFSHPNGSVVATDSLGGIRGENVNLVAVDAFYEHPIGNNGSAISAYATYQMNDYGQDYKYSAYGTGSMIYGHIGYLIPNHIKNAKFQPYVSYGYNTYQSTTSTLNVLGVGINTYFSGHNSKLTLEYKDQNFGGTSNGVLTLQAMIFL
ncbi:MAG: hypothetical protein ACWA41_01555 [Putridiphycobacter sp.]